MSQSLSSQPQSEQRQLVRTAMKAPYLTREEEKALALRWRDDKDQEALDRLALAHMRLVISVASRFRNFGLPLGDLIQEGHVGLLEAAARFEPERDIRFSTYATWWIRASIQDFILRNWSIVRGGTSSNQKSLFFNLRRLRAKLSGKREHLPDSEVHRKIAEALGVKPHDVAVMNARLSGPDTSLNAPVVSGDEGGSDRQDFLVSDAPLPDEVVARSIDDERRHNWLKSALKVLSERELEIVRQRRLSEEGATLETLGNRLGISKERVRQIESRAMEKLKVALLAKQADRAAFSH
ncbi:RNA polymerase factor sigma-32 [Roseibium limicola]|uniref:RNA polymerase factor sigma-32 n=1 Tax=Roseibium limicola TaxID=2816037 RepID=A0A939EQ66_9HYPH|nr:RNA polymerase factor sigma-32 [Roseibium limicola]MBO0346706.1 RNA polymerase factor sigma-32 [Roseibium limicola]